MRSSRPEDDGPYELELPGRYSQASPPTKEGFTGYEKDPAAGLSYAGHRYYMAAFGRFTTRDWYAEKYPFLAPYQYAANNPITNIDVNGDSVIVGFTPIKADPTGTTQHSVLVHIDEETDTRTVIAEANNEGVLRDGVRGWGQLVKTVDTEAETKTDIFTSENSETVKIPEGMSEAEFVQSIVDATEQYEDGSLPYSPLPHLEPGTVTGTKPFGNSNAYVGSVLRAAGSDHDPANGRPMRSIGPVVLPKPKQTKAPGWNLDILPSKNN